MSLWSKLIGVRYRSVLTLKQTWRTYSGERPSHLRAWARTLQLIVKPRKTILCYPTRPSPYSVLYKLCTLAGYWITTDPQKPCDAVFRWDNTTWSRLESLPHEAAAVNRRCTDISKRHVSGVFADIFGYDLLVDPTTYDGRMVKKSDENCTHDGEFVNGPISPDDVVPGYVYQKAVDNRRDDAAGFYEYRVPVLGETIPVVYVKYRPLGGQFKGFDGAEVVAPATALSEQERDRLLAFAEALGMDYGELDVLRDRLDGRVYVVDANNTPSGPERGFRTEQSVGALRALQPAFESLLAESARRLKGPPFRSDEERLGDATRELRMRRLTEIVERVHERWLLSPNLLQDPIENRELSYGPA